MLPAITVLTGLAVIAAAEHPGSGKSHHHEGSQAPLDSWSLVTKKHGLDVAKMIERSHSNDRAHQQRTLKVDGEITTQGSERNDMEAAASMLLGAMSSLAMAFGTAMMAFGKFMSTYIAWIAKEFFGLSSVGEWTQKTTQMNNAMTSGTLQAAAAGVPAAKLAPSGNAHAKQPGETQMFSEIWGKYTQGEFMSLEQLNSLLRATDHELGAQKLTDTEWQSLCKEKGADPSQGLSQHDLLSMYFDDRKHPESSIKQDYLRIFAEGGTPPPPGGKSFLQKSSQQVNLMTYESTQPKRILQMLQPEPKKISRHDPS